MRRYARILIFIVVLVVLSGLAVGIKTITIGNFVRGDEETLLGLTLGLDLQGGSHLVYQSRKIDDDGEPIPAPSADQMDSLKKIIERRLNSSGLGEPIVQVLGQDRLLVQIPGVSDPEKAKDLIGETAQLEFKHRSIRVLSTLEFAEGEIIGYRIAEITPELFLPAEDDGEAENVESESDPTEKTENADAGESDSANDEDDATANAEDDEGAEDETAAVPGPPGLELEFNEAGFAKFSAIVNDMRDSLIPSPGTGRAYPDQLILPLAVGDAPEVGVLYQQVALVDGGQLITLGGDPFIREIVGTTKFVIDLSEAFFNSDDPLADAQARLDPERKFELKLMEGSVLDDIGLTGEDLARAYPGQNQTSGAPIVNLQFNSEGTKKFAEITTKIAGTDDQIAIFLDDDELIAPVAQQAITGGNAFISGQGFTIERVRDIALLLEAGRLPFDIELQLERDVDAILGSDSLEKSVRAGVVGLILVFLFMLLYYRMPGLIAASALLIYALMLIAIFKMLPVTLTLSGVAAAILSVGMAVDANILIFERMKEEMRAGRTLLSAINIGFNRAWSAIRDSNVSTLITAGILYWFSDTLGATVVQGFAATLAIGVMLSMFSAIFVSRTLLRIVALTVIGRKLRWFVPTEGKSLPQLQLEPRG